jgi:perosamine synthetase
MQYDPRAPCVNGTAGDIPLCVPNIGGAEWSYVKECLDSNFVSSVGPFVERFEGAIAGYVGAEHAVATVNGTAALHVALLVAGVEPDDEVLVSTLSFIAPANAIRYVGAWPVFIDADPHNWQMDPSRAIEFLERDCQWSAGELRNRATGRRVRAIVPVHILGHPVDLDPIVEAARKFGLAVVEDATESLGARYKGRMVGNVGDIACFSFNGNKLITTGGGGMIVTSNAEWADRARYLTTQAKDDPYEYIHGTVAYNYRLTNIQAALGCAQMMRIESFIDAKREIAAEYNAALSSIDGYTVMSEAPWARSVWWLYSVRIDELKLGIGSRTLGSMLAKAGIQTRPLWQPLHISPAHARWSSRNCPQAELLASDVLSLPCSTAITLQEQHRVIDALQEIASC